MAASFEYVFPAIRGLQAGRPYYTSMCPLHLIPKIFLFDEEEVAADVRAQRSINRSRLPDITRYLLENSEDYVFSAITASVDGALRFEPFSEEEATRNLGTLHVPMSSRFLINDGQHRRGAIEEALKAKPELGYESIAVVFFEDRGLERAQQMFTDLNQHAVRPSRSLGLLYDHRSEKAWLAKEMAQRVETFRGRVEMEKSTLGRRSAKMFTLSAIETATSALLADKQDQSLEERAQIGAHFWKVIAHHMPEWKLVKNNDLSGGEFRRDYICAHGIALSALAHVGRTLLAHHPDDWSDQLTALEGVDWSRTNKAWEGRALRGGKISKSHMCVRLTTAALKHRLHLPLSPDELATEKEADLGLPALS